MYHHHDRYNLPPFLRFSMYSCCINSFVMVTSTKFLYWILLGFTLLWMGACSRINKKNTENPSTVIIEPKEANPVEIQKPDLPKPLRLSAALFDRYLGKLQGQRVALVVNHTALVGDTHLADTLKALGVNLVKIFAPEHGFRGNVDAGKKVSNDYDERTQLPIVSLYGDNRKPTAAQLQEVDVVLFDIQDVGARFYTYISTLHLVMEACAENQKKILVFDRPNPNGSYFDGPLLQPGLQSFVGMHPIPIVHGLTIGELASMINGEGWLKNGVKCDLEVVKMENYTHQLAYSLPVKPSPNLPNDLAIQLYPSLCLFEGTVMSVGRGTDEPFQMLGYPDSRMGDFSFEPRSIVGMAENPLYKNQTCYGLDLRSSTFSKKFTLQYLIDFYQKFPNKAKFFNSFFDKLAGTSVLRTQIEAGMSEADIRQTWQADLDSYAQLRQKYLLYPD